ncbi:DMT family transporter [Bifidobacterium eulemuris]|nr:DMT family transporter [Bifidobacterium eulemuris]QOL33285.1 DMT family transporter [Bifidobacterium eulemuris]
MMCLLLTALIWGSSFVAQVRGMDSMSPMFFNACRFTLGALSLLPVLAVMRLHARAKRVTRGSEGTDPSVMLKTGDEAHGGRDAAAIRRHIGVGTLCGTILFAASTLQQYGILLDRSAGRAGFLTALYIVMVPLLAWLFMRRRVGLPVVVAVVLSLAGFHLLCVTDGFGPLAGADVLLLLSAVSFAVHILAIDTLGSTLDAVALSFVQFCATAALSWIGALAEGSIYWPGAAGSLGSLLYAGIASVGVAYTLQVVGQQWVPPTRASLIMSLESFFSALGGALLLGEVMSPRGYLGCALIFLGTMLAQMPARLPAFLRKDASD